MVYNYDYNKNDIRSSRGLATLTAEVALLLEQSLIAVGICGNTYQIS